MASSQEILVPQSPAEPARAAPALWPLLVLAALAMLLYRAVLIKLSHDWWEIPDFSHGFIVPLFSGFLIYRDRARLMVIPKKPTWIGLVVIVFALAQLVIGVMGAELFLSRTSGILLMIGLVLTFWGWQLLQALVFPITFLLFCIPIPQIIFNQITFPLQLLASQLSAVLLPLLQVPVLREGNVIQLPAMSLEVAEACSGIRSLLSLGTLAVVYGFFLEKSTWKRVILILASIPVAIAANAIRIVGTGLCVQFWDPDKALGFFHEFSGWVVFVVSIVMLCAVHSALGMIGSRKEIT